MDLNILTSYYKSRETILAQLSEAGYDTSPFHLRVSEFTGNLDFCAIHKTTRARAYVYYSLKKITIDAAIIRNILEEQFIYGEDTPFDKKVDTLMYITHTDPSVSIQEQIRTLYLADGIFMTWQTIERTQYNVLSHILVPRFDILPDATEANVTNEKETDETKTEQKEDNDLLRQTGNDVKTVQDLLQKFHTTRDNLPTESRFSPPFLAKLVRPGQVVCYYRPSATAMIAPHWVLCV